MKAEFVFTPKNHRICRGIRPKTISSLFRGTQLNILLWLRRLWKVSRRKYKSRLTVSANSENSWLQFSG
ncbi:MAG: hypothetical protein KJO61_07955, partial [Deltaproteobacteria bacterium]|nr:hypothetical protein [Deltaproteobacteria bacterium]